MLPRQRENSLKQFALNAAELQGFLSSLLKAKATIAANVLQKEKQLNLEDGFIKEKFVQDRTEIKREQPAIIVRLPMYVDLM